MKANLGDMMDIMEDLAPLALSEDWDNSGLQIGHRNQQVKKVMVALDPSVQVVEAACHDNADLLITHHPLIFNPLRSIDLKTPIGKIISLAIENKLSIYSAHTNLDVAHDGINDILARKIGLNDLTVLNMTHKPFDLQVDGKNVGIGRIGVVEEKMDLYKLAEHVKSRLALKCVRVAGKQDLLIHKVAVCCGSGSSLLDRFFSSGAEAFVAGDLRYHDARDAEALNCGLIDIGHFASEHLMLNVLVDKLNHKVKERHLDVVTKAYVLESDPFIVY